MLKNMSKKAQGTVVPALIIALALFLVVYIYAMPKAEKCETMPDLAECHETENAAAKIEPITIFSDSPGFLEAQERTSVYAVKPVEIFSKDEVDIATILEKAVINRSWIYYNDKKEIFPAHEKGKVVKISIYVSRSKGKLKVSINPSLSYIFEGTGVHEISVPASLLNKTNTIKFSVSIPILPTELNFYNIEKVIIKETYSLTDLSASRNVSIEEDVSQVKYASLTFGSDCITKELLTLALNGKQLSNAIICGTSTFDITNNIKAKNEMVFSSHGNYFIHPISIDLYFKKVNHTTYYFALENDELKDALKGTKLAMLHMEFDSTQRKKLEIIINDNKLETETNTAIYKMLINDYIVEGINKIKIIPRTDINFKKVELILE